MQKIKIVTTIQLISRLPFKKKFLFKKRIVWYRYDNDDSAIALNEWGRNKYLEYIIGIPLLIIICVVAIPVIPIILILKKINKEKGEAIGYAIGNFIDKLKEKDHPDFQVKPFRSNQEFVNTFKNKERKKNLLRVLFLHEKNIETLYGISKRRLNKYVDEIWLYNDLQEIYDKAIAENANIESSTILFEELKHESVLLTHNINALNIAKERYRKAQYKEAQLSKGIVPRIQLAVNNILPPNIILYLESKFHPEINEYLTLHYESINNKLNEVGKRLLYLPLALEKKADSLVNFIKYNHPNFEEQSIHEIDTTISSSISAEILTNGLIESLSIPSDIPECCFIRCVQNSQFYSNESCEYSVFSLILEKEELLADRIDFYFSMVGQKNDDSLVYYQKGTINQDDPDDAFYLLGNKIESEFKATIDNIKKMNDDKLLFSSMEYIIENLKDKHPELCRKINKTLFESLQNQQSQIISRLVIDDQYRILLPDYNNMEIEMGPLPKTIFIFLLRHPEGVMFKELRPHQNELIDIYSKVGNRLDMDQIKQSIKELTDPRSNSINEKCSRIKEAFISKMDESLAKYYFVTGSRSNPKGIQLDRSLVHFH